MGSIAFTAPSPAVRVLWCGDWSGSIVDIGRGRCIQSHRRANRPCNRACARISATIDELLESSDYLSRIRGIAKVDEMTSTSAQVSQLVKLTTEDSNSQVRYAAISRLSNLDASRLTDEDSQNVLQAARYTLINDKEPSCQAAAADLIAGLRLADGFDDLVQAFNSTSDWVLKFSIAAGVGEMRHPKAFDFLKGVLDNDSGESKDYLLIAAAIGALGDLGDPRGASVIEKYLEHPDSSIQGRARIAKDLLSDTGSSPS